MQKQRLGKSPRKILYNNPIQASYQKYKGLDFVETHQFGSTEKTVILAKWVRPKWADKPMIKLDFPSMGYVSYEAVPIPKKHGET